MEKVVRHLISHHVLREEEYDLYLYSFTQLFIIVCHIAAYFAIAYFYHEVWTLIAFLAAFIPLRSYAGGYHASKQLTCYFVSVATVFGILTLMKFSNIGIGVFLVLALFSFLVIVLMAPRESKNKPYEDGDRAYYRKKTLSILNGEALFAIIFSWLGYRDLSEALFLAWTLVAVLLLLDRSELAKTPSNPYQDMKH